MMKKQFFLLFSVLLGYSAISFAYDPTRGALQNAPELRSYGYNQQDLYNRNHPSVNSGNSYNNSGNSYNNMNPVIIDVPSKYGAIVYSKKTGLITDSANEDSLEEAKRVAIRKCEKGDPSKSCVVFSWVRNGCLAMATGQKNGRRTIMTGSSRMEGKSEKDALKRCISSKSEECTIIAPERCSLPAPL